MSEFPAVLANGFNAIADDLVVRGWSMQPQLLPAELGLALEAQCRQLWQADALTPAAIGRGSDEQVVPDVRGDYTRWLDDCPDHPATADFLGFMAGLRLALNRTLFLGLDTFECHFALYPPGAGYSKHMDRFQDNPLRTVSVVAYLNSQWQPGDGGELRLHLPEGVRDVDPVAGTVAVFLSDSILHEVLPSRCERASLTGWFRRRPDNPLLR
ncbi:MAG: 2OG-Fe(II) oxygenase [Pseudomonadaceae bacterium]|nr:MAG: 2OG-Fe(II) oxygenase [Pseudomonadaceae bacterium]